jgi:hypothetical protein
VILLMGCIVTVKLWPWCWCPNYTHINTIYSWFSPDYYLLPLLSSIYPCYWMPHLDILFFNYLYLLSTKPPFVIPTEFPSLFEYYCLCLSYIYVYAPLFTELLYTIDSCL